MLLFVFFIIVLSDDIMSIDSISALNGETSIKLIFLSVSKTYFILSVFAILSRVSDKYNTEYVLLPVSAPV